MEETKTRKKISKKTAVVIIVAAVCVAIIAISAVVAGHTVYVKDSEALITNVEDFRVDRPQFYTYVYKDGLKSLDFSEVIKVSKGASFYIDKIQDEDEKVTKAEGTVLDLSVHSQRLAVVRVVSKNGVGKTDYRITVVPKASENNVIDFNVTDAEIDPDDIVLNYSGEVDVVLPVPKKEYKALSGNTYNYEFLGWYTSPDYAEETKIDRIEAGTQGGISLYARFADASNAVKRDGYTYVTLGSYPQSQVTDFALYTAIRRSDAYKNADNNSQFTYNGKTYYKFAPENLPNVSENGYSSNGVYVFNVEPVEWRVLAKKDANVSSGQQTLLSVNILNCASYSTNDESVMKTLYNTIYTNKALSSIINLDSFMRYFFDGDTAYGMDNNNEGAWGTINKLIKIQVEGNYLHRKMDELADGMFSASDKSKITARTLTRYKLGSDGTETYSCTVFPLNYSEAINENYGFNPDFRFNDPLRKALVTDFAAANGVYVASSGAHKGQGSWWLRGAGGAQGKTYGNATDGYGYKDKRIAYVKYTGYVHAYGSLNNNIRSGMRPAVIVNSIAGL